MNHATHAFAATDLLLIRRLHLAAQAFSATGRLRQQHELEHRGERGRPQVPIHNLLAEHFHARWASRLHRIGPDGSRVALVRELGRNLCAGQDEAVVRHEEEVSGVQSHRLLNTLPLHGDVDSTVFDIDAVSQAQATQLVVRLEVFAESLVLLHETADELRDLAGRLLVHSALHPFEHTGQLGKRRGAQGDVSTTRRTGARRRCLVLWGLGRRWEELNVPEERASRYRGLQGARVSRIILSRA
eukprot:scaffold565_cov379-Pinguiococcus_pyrenoidosus.AAC.15